MAIVFEAIAFLIGALLRIRMHANYDPTGGYDFRSHRRYIDYVARYNLLPSMHSYRTAYHPPLFYWISALFTRLGWDDHRLQWVSIGLGVATLLVTWYGLRRLLPDDPLARVFALLIASLLPCSIFNSGMIANEQLNQFLCTLALVLLALCARAAGRAAWILAIALGTTLGLALLTKVSGLIFVMLCGLAALVLFVREQGPFIRRLARAAPLLVAAILPMAISVPYQARHYGTTGKLYPTGFDGRDDERKTVASIASIPYWHRRPPKFYYGMGGWQLYRTPWYPTFSRWESRFFPVLFASTFVDFFNFNFAGPADDQPTIDVNHKPLSLYTARFMRAALIGGLPIAIATTLATLFAAIYLLRRRDLSRGLMVMAAILGVLGQMHFATLYPFDQYGPVKGHYLLFASAPLCALFGVAVSWCWRRPRPWMRWVVLIEVIGLLLVTANVLEARRLWIGPGTKARDLIANTNWFQPS